MLKEFKDFILRGNVIDLAVGIVVGGAFGAVVSSFVKDILTPLIAAIGGEPNFASLHFTLHNSTFYYGDFINAVISFLLIAIVIFFLVVKPMNTLAKKVPKKEQEDLTKKKCPECASTIPTEAKRCPFCTAFLESTTPRLE